MSIKFTGGIEDSYTIAFLLLLLGVLALVGFYFADKIMTTMESVSIPGVGTIATVNPALHSQATGAFGFIDGVLAFVLVLLIGGAFALAFYSRGKTYLAIISIFIQIFFLIGSYFVRMFWQAFSTSNSEFTSIAITNFPITSLIMNYMPFISFITLIGIIILFFTKPREDYAVGV